MLLRIWAVAALLLPTPGMPRQADPFEALLKKGDDYYRRAAKLFENKKYSEGNAVKDSGLAVYRQVIKQYPQRVHGYRRLGDLLRLNGMTTELLTQAIANYQKVLQIAKDADTYNQLGLSYSNLGKNAEASAAFEEAARTDPTVPVYLYNQGFTYAELLNFDAAHLVHQRLQSIDPAQARKLLDRIYKLSGEGSLVNRPARYDNPRIELVAIPAGSFEMGARTGSNPPVRGRAVAIKTGFYMGKYPVTQGQWQMVMGDNPSFFKTCGPTCPVEQVSWHDAQAFVTRLNLLKDGFKYRLPSETEWEYAYRAAPGR
jgi:tetratricopeptide (TPR) repeat protein